MNVAGELYYVTSISKSGMVQLRSSFDLKSMCCHRSKLIQPDDLGVGDELVIKISETSTPKTFQLSSSFRASLILEGQIHRRDNRFVVSGSNNLLDVYVSPSIKLGFCPPGRTTTSSSALTVYGQAVSCLMDPIHLGYGRWTYKYNYKIVKLFHQIQPTHAMLRICRQNINTDIDPWFVTQTPDENVVRIKRHLSKLSKVYENILLIPNETWEIMDLVVNQKMCRIFAIQNKTDSFLKVAKMEVVCQSSTCTFSDPILSCGGTSTILEKGQRGHLEVGVVMSGLGAVEGYFLIKFENGIVHGRKIRVICDRTSNKIDNALISVASTKKRNKRQMEEIWSKACGRVLVDLFQNFNKANKKLEPDYESPDEEPFESAPQSRLQNAETASSEDSDGSGDGAKFKKVFRGGRESKLVRYYIPSIIHETLENEDIVSFAGRVDNMNFKQLTLNHYRSQLHLALFFEEQFCQIRRRIYDICGISISQHEEPVTIRGTQIPQGQLFELTVPNLSSIQPAVSILDRVIIRTLNEEDRSLGVVVSVVINFGEPEKLICQLPSDFTRMIEDGRTKVISFECNSIPFMRMHNAIDYLGSDILESICFPVVKAYDGNVYEHDLVTAHQKNLSECNEEQLLAIRQIVNGNFGPAPFILFGPIGTGKTSTLANVIYVLRHTNETAGGSILVTAPSNCAADVLAIAIKRKTVSTHLVRIYSDVAGETIHPDLVLCSEVINPKTKSGESLLDKKIFVTTLSTAIQLRGWRRNWSYIFIDEAGFAIEPDALIPISYMVQKHTKVVIAGDVKQLRPVIMSNNIVTAILRVSFMERLLHSDIYYTDESKKHLDPLYAVQLKVCYRLDPFVLNMVSHLFYDDSLRSPDPTRGDGLLPKKMDLQFMSNISYLFHSVRGENKYEEGSYSYFNIAECLVIMTYLEKLKVENVSFQNVFIITPYLAQVKMLKLMFLQKFPNVVPPEICTVETVQGGEREIVIFSVVRSDGFVNYFAKEKSLAFVFDPNRLNVAVTRAISKLIIVGNPHILCQDSSWEYLVKHALDHGYIAGDDFPVTLDKRIWPIFNEYFGDAD